MADKNEPATRWYRDAVRLNPKDGGSWYNLGVAYQRLQRKDEAIAAYQKAAELNPIHKPYRSALEALKGTTENQ